MSLNIGSVKDKRRVHNINAPFNILIVNNAIDERRLMNMFETFMT